MKLKSFTFILAIFLSAESLNAVRTFQPLKPYQCPSEEYRPQFSAQLIKDQDAINEGIEKGLINQEDINRCFNFPTLTNVAGKEIKVDYRPGQISPRIITPQGALLARENFIIDQFIQMSWYQKLEKFDNLPSAFGRRIYSVSIPIERNEYKVGEFVVCLLDPDSYLNHVRKIRHQGIIKTCLKNPKLMKVLDIILNGSNKKASKVLTQDTVSEVAKLLQAVFSGSVQHKNPKDGIFLTITTPLGTLNLPTTQNRRERPYRSHIRALLKDYLTQGGVNLSLDKRYLIVEPTTK